MAIESPYITDGQFQRILARLSITLDDEDQQDLADRAQAALEGELVERFIVPLRSAAGGAFEAAPAFSRNLVLSAMKSKLRSLIGTDQNRNVVVEQGQRYIDLHQGEFNGYVKSLKDPKRDFGLQLQPQAVGGLEPIQTLGVARADNHPHRVIDPDAI
jgi:hypothetical protein